MSARRRVVCAVLAVPCLLAAWFWGYLLDVTRDERSAR